jgi:6-phosphogluconolactonase
MAGADQFGALAGAAISARGRFGVAFSGGSTPRAMFRLLSAEPYRTAIGWAKLDVFWSDERAVPPDDPQSNYRMASESLLSQVPVLPDHVHRMPADREPLDAAANEYAAQITNALGAGPSGTPRFDLIMLGMGGDGHTASLFPETEALDERQRLVASNYVPKLDARRMTFTPKLINAAANVLFLVAGQDKSEALKAVIEGPRKPRLFPAQLVAPDDGNLYWYVDEAAASRLRPRGSRQ